MEPQSLDEVRPGCYDVHERVKDMDAGGVLASMNFPSFPTFTGTHLPERRPRAVQRPGAGLQRLAHRRVVRRLPRPLHPHGRARVWSAEETAAEVRRGGQGLPLAQLHREPGGARLPQLPRRVLGPGVAGVRRHRHGPVGAPGSSGRLLDPGRRLAARRDDHAAAHEHPVGGRPTCCGRGCSRPTPTCASPCPRAAPAGSPTSSTGRPHLRDAPGLDPAGLRRPAAQRGVPRALPHLLHQRPGRGAAAGGSASTTCAGRPTTRTATRCGPRPPRLTRCSPPTQ